MLTFLFSMTVKAGREQEFADVTKRLTTTTRAEDKGCLTYVFLQQRNSPSSKRHASFVMSLSRSAASPLLPRPENFEEDALGLL
jgi:quinol monooxygenase YgiN